MCTCAHVCVLHARNSPSLRSVDWVLKDPETTGHRPKDDPLKGVVLRTIGGLRAPKEITCAHVQTYYYSSRLRRSSAPTAQRRGPLIGPSGRWPSLGGRAVRPLSADPRLRRGDRRIKNTEGRNNDPLRGSLGPPKVATSMCTSAHQQT